MFAQSKGGNYSLTNGASGVADAIDFDGATDYLSRSSDLAGNADGKTFTFSAWVWFDGTATSYIIQKANTWRFYVACSGSAISISADNPSGVGVLLATTPVYVKNTYINILVSIDLSSASNRYFYINDAPSTVTWTTYSNDVIDFADANGWVVGGPTKLKGRLSHVFLDYTYRDLSIEANRRLFITADRKPAANQAALNPILYLPMSDPTQPGKNLGTGGDFTLNGVVARSGRGPSQFNAPYSDLDGAADYLSRTSAITGITTTGVITISCNFNYDSASPLALVFGIDNGTSFRFNLRMYSGYCVLIGRNNALAELIYLVINNGAAHSFIAGRNYTLTVSFDLSDTNKRHVYVNGQVPGYVSWGAYVNGSFEFGSWGRVRVGANNGDIPEYYFNGRIGNIFFDTRYIDLSQPANLAKFVTGTGIDAKPADLGANGEKPFGTPPLIYLPMYGNNAGKNYGTGGDFSVVSGPFAGSRGPNEFWGNKADFDGSTGYLSRASALAGVANGKVFSGSFYVSVDVDASARSIIAMSSGGSNDSGVQIYRNLANKIVISAFNAMTGQLLTATTSSLVNVAGGTFHIAYCFDLSNTAKRCVCINGVLDTSVSYANYTNASISFANTAVIRVGASAYLSPSDYLDGRLSEFYFTTEYIDFSQEANRLKFRDAFGNPVDLAPQIAAGTLPNPAIYMRFDPANFGKNSGTGGDFTVSGTITDGGQL